MDKGLAALPTNARGPEGLYIFAAYARCLPGQGVQALGVSGGNPMENEEGKRRDAILLVEWMGTGLPTQAEIEEEVRSFGRDHFPEEPILAWDYLADVATERGIRTEDTEVRA